MKTLYEQDGTVAPAAEVMETAAELAALELSRRGASLSPDDLKPLVLAFLAKHDHELQCVAYLDAMMRLIEFKVVTEGDTKSVEMNLREAIRPTFTNTAFGVILIHNHPGSVAKASDADKRVTITSKIAFEIFGVSVLDTWIVAGNEVYSIREEEMKEATEDMPSELKKLMDLLANRHKDGHS